MGYERDYSVAQLRFGDSGIPRGEEMLGQFST